MALLALGALAIGAPAAGAAEPSAIEEYVLTLPGVATNDAGKPRPQAGALRRSAGTGVTGEREQPQTPLGAAIGALPTIGGLLVLTGLAAGGLLALRRREE